MWSRKDGALPEERILDQRETSILHGQDLLVVDFSDSTNVMIKVQEFFTFPSFLNPNPSWIRLRLEQTWGNRLKK